MIDVRLAGIRQASASIKLFELADARGRALPRLPPGSHLDLHVPSGDVRPYFVAERTNRGSYVIGVRRDPDGTVSKQLHDKLRAGAALRIEPRPNAPNGPARDEGGLPAWLVAEDVGIFCAWSYARAFDAAARRFRLYYDAWSPDDSALLPQLAAFAPRVETRFRSLHRGEGPDWRMVAAQIDVPGRVYGAGSPATSLRFAQAFLGDGRGLADCVVWTNAVSERNAGPHDFDVVLARSGATVSVHRDESILDALEREGLAAKHFCRGGICGVCRTRVVEGTPLHRDAVLNEYERAAGDVMMICRSRARGPRLVLDL